MSTGRAGLFTPQDAARDRLQDLVPAVGPGHERARGGQGMLRAGQRPPFGHVSFLGSLVGRPVVGLHAGNHGCQPGLALRGGLEVDELGLVPDSCTRPRGRRPLRPVRPSRTAASRCRRIPRSAPGRPGTAHAGMRPRAGFEHDRREVQPGDRGAGRRPLRRELGERRGHKDPDPLIRRAERGALFAAASCLRRHHPRPAPFRRQLASRMPGCIARL